MKSDKKLDIEMMRIFAAFFVLFNHTGNGGYLLFSQYDPNQAQFWIYLLIAVFTKFAIFLFLMITGALMLNREPEPIKDLWKNRVLRMVLIVLVWVFVYYCVEVKKGNASFGIRQFLKGIYGSALSEWNSALWYLYAHIALLITLPLLQKIARSLSNRDYLYMIGLFFAYSSLLPAAEQLLWQNKYHLTDSFNFDWICSLLLFYPLLGYFLQHRAKDFWNKKRVAFLWAVNIAALILTCYMSYQKILTLDSVDTGEIETTFKLFVAVNAATIFVTFQYLASHVNINKYFQKIICSLGGCTFGIYLMHILFLYKTTAHWRFAQGFRHWLHMNDIVSSLLACVCIFLICYAVTLLLKRIPLIKKLV